MTNKLTLIWVEMTWLSLVWTIMPVSVIYFMHWKNY